MKRRTEQPIPDRVHLTQQQAEQIYKQGREAVVFALLKQAQMLAEGNNLPATIAADPSSLRREIITMNRELRTVFSARWAECGENHLIRGAATPP